MLEMSKEIRLLATLQAEPFLTVHMLCNKKIKHKAKRDKRGSAYRVAAHLLEVE